MSQVALVSDRFWFAIDVYDRQPNQLVKRLTKGPFQTTKGQAPVTLHETIEENPGAQIFAFRYDTRTNRWLRWV